MGTRSLTYVYSEDTPLINMYRQYDGYPTGHGAELAEFLSGFEIVNGYGEVKPKLANGMGCLAAQLIANFKQSVGGFYIYAVTDNDCGQEYEYHVYENRVVVKDPTAVIFEGDYQSFAEFCSETV
jgi:hypothetical protein